MKHISIFLFAMFCFSISQAQVKQLWTQSYSSSINWQQVTPYGHYIVGGSDALMALNPENGEEIWSVPEFANVPMNAVSQIGGSPLLTVNDGSNIALIDPFSGKKMFDSRKAGILEIIDQFVLYNANGILISGRNQDQKETIVMTSLETGEVMWNIREDYGRVVAVNEVATNEALIITLFYNYRINTSTGEILWRNDVSAEANKQLEKLGGFGSLLKQAATNQANQMDINIAFYQHPTLDMFIIASEQEGAAQTSGFSTSSGSQEQYNTTYIAFTLSSGDRIWDKDLQVDGKLGTLYFTEKGFVSLPNDGGRTKINLYSYENAEGLWGKKGRGIRIKGGIYDFVEVDGNLMLVTGNGQKNFISYLDVQNGTLAFDKPIKIDGRLTFSEKISTGLMFTTTEEVNILDPSSGSLILPDLINLGGALTQDANALYAFDVKDDVIKKLDKTTGKVSVISPEIKFSGKESPTNLELRQEGLLVTSEQNMMLVDMNGKVVYSKYLEAPREPGILRALRFANGVYAAYVGVLSYSATAQLSAISQEHSDNLAVTNIADGLGQAYGELGDTSTKFAKQSFEMANARFKATKDGDNYRVILSKMEKGNALVQVSKETGEETGNISLGNEREPDYAMDGVLGYIFYRTGTSSIVGYKL